MKIDLSQRLSISFEGRRPPYFHAVHVILSVVATTSDLRNALFLKGGTLMALAYESSRHTTDIDFSAPITKEEFDAIEFLNLFNDALIRQSSESGFGIACRLQSRKWEPQKGNPTFPALKLKIAFAETHDSKQMHMLKNGKGINTVSIDISLNEPVKDIVSLYDDNGISVLAYGTNELMAEKFRALVQQKDRNRQRGQDVYDLFFLIEKLSPFGEEQKRETLNRFLEKSESRGLNVNKFTLRDDEIINRAERDYPRLENEIRDYFPSFLEAYTKIRDYFESLPWEEKI